MTAADDPTERDPGTEPAPRGTLRRWGLPLAAVTVVLGMVVPACFGSAGAANVRSTESALTNAVTAAKAIFINSSSGYGTTAEAIRNLRTTVPGFTYTGQPVTAGTVVSVSVAVSPDGSILILGAQSTNGHCFFSEDNENGRFTTDGMHGASPDPGLTYTATDVRTDCWSYGPGLALTWATSYPGPPTT